MSKTAMVVTDQSDYTSGGATYKNTQEEQRDNFNAIEAVTTDGDTDAAVKTEADGTLVRKGFDSALGIFIEQENIISGDSYTNGLYYFDPTSKFVYEYLGVTGVWTDPGGGVSGDTTNWKFITSPKINSNGGIDLTGEINSPAMFRGDDGRKYRVVSGAIRNEGTGNGWEFIDDSFHDPIGVSSISEDSTEITIDFNFTSTKVISFVITPDETFVGKYAAGASVGLDSCIIRISEIPLSISCYVYYDGSWNVVNASGNYTFGSFTSGTLTLNHDDVGNPSAPNISPRNPLAQAHADAQTSTTTTIKFYDTTGSIITTPNSNMQTFVSRTGRENGQISPADLSSVSGNFWFYGVFEVSDF